MTVISEIMFWLSACVVMYAYVFYPALLFALYVLGDSAGSMTFLVSREGRRISDRGDQVQGDWPSVALLLAARNEEEMLPRKIRNFLEIDYPQDRIEMLVGSDASGDRTVEIGRAAPDGRIRTFDFTDRSGKIGVLHKLLSETRADIVVLSDANTFFRPDAVRNLVRHFRDPKVGAVCGELRLEAPDGTLASEGAYWRYETALKTMESRLGCVLGANGGNYAVRRELFPSIPPDTIIEDFVIPLKIREKGYLTPFEPEAVAMERNPMDPAGEFRRRARIGAGCAQALRLIAPLLSPRFGALAFALWSHKVMRWLVPFAMIAAFFSNLLLLGEPLYRVTLWMQAAVYALGAAGFARHKRGRPLGALGIPFMFVLLNAALLKGYADYASGRHRVTWERTNRVEEK